MRIIERISGSGSMPSPESKYINAEVRLSTWLDDHKVKGKPKVSIMTVLIRNRSKFQESSNRKFAVDLAQQVANVIAALELRNEVKILGERKSATKVQEELVTIFLRALFP